MIIEKDFFVGINNCNKDLEISNISILQFLEEIAGIHSGLAGYGVYEIPITNKTWIALGWKVNIIRRPKYLEDIHIKTWCRCDEKNLYSYRDFLILDSDNKEIIKASSKWVLIDVKSKRICKLDLNISKEYKYEKKKIFDSECEFKWKENKDLEFLSEIKIDDSMIDFNNHLHNTNYIKIAEDALKIKDTFSHSNFEIMYKKEIKQGDLVKIYYNKNNETHDITLKSDDDKILYSIIKFY